MNKKIWLVAFLLFGITSVSASLGNCDVNGDEEINIVDLAYVAKIQGWYSESNLNFDLNSDEIPTPTGSPENKRLELQIALENTSKNDWRKRAKLASQIVKIGLGE